MAHSMVGFSTPFWVDFRLRFGWFLRSVFTPVLTVIFTAPFRLVTAPEITCFIGFFGIGPPF